MTKISIKGIDSARLLEFFKRADIGSPQTLEIIGDKLVSRAYPKSKAFIKIEKIELPLKNGSETRVKLPMLSLSKMISSLALLKGDVDVDFEESNEIIDKTIIYNKKTKLTVPSGDLGLVSPPLPDDVWENLSNVNDSSMVFNLSLDDIGYLYKLNVIETGTTSKQIQRVGALKIGNKTLDFTNPSNDDGKDVWSHSITEIEKHDEESGEWLFNIRNLNYFQDVACKAYLKKSPKDDNIKILVLKGERSDMLIMLNKQ